MDNLVLLNKDHVSLVFFNDKEMKITYQMNNARIIEQKVNDFDSYEHMKERLKSWFEKTIGIE